MRIRVTFTVMGALTFGAHAALVGQTLQRLSAQGTTRVEVFAEGNVKNVVSQPSDVTDVTGSLGIRYLGSTYIATGVINVAGTFDTVTTGFGATLLAPATGKGLNAGLLDIRRRHFFGLGKACKGLKGDLPIKCNIGFHAYGSVASHRWATRTDTEGIPLATQDVQVWGSGIGFFYNFFDGTVGDSLEKKPVAMVLDVGLAGRHLRGDLFSQDTLRTRLLNGDDRRNFYGLEIGLGIQYEQIKAGLNYYFMNGNVNGLSHGQVVAGVSIQANLNSGKLNRSDTAEGEGKAGDKDKQDAGAGTDTGGGAAGQPPAEQPADSAK